MLLCFLFIHANGAGHVRIHVLVVLDIQYVPLGRYLANCDVASISVCCYASEI